MNDPVLVWLKAQKKHWAEVKNNYINNQAKFDYVLTVAAKISVSRRASEELKKQ